MNIFMTKDDEFYDEYFYDFYDFYDAVFELLVICKRQTERVFQKI